MSCTLAVKVEVWGFTHPQPFAMSCQQLSAGDGRPVYKISFALMCRLAVFETVFRARAIYRLVQEMFVCMANNISVLLVLYAIMVYHIIYENMLCV